MPIPMDGVPLSPTHRKIIEELNGRREEGTRHIPKMGDKTKKKWIERGWMTIRYDSEQFDPNRERPYYVITKLGSEVAKNDFEYKYFGRKPVPPDWDGPPMYAAVP